MTTYDEIIAYAPIATFLQNRDTADNIEDIVRRAQSWVVERIDHDLFEEVLAPTTISTTGLIDTSGYDRILEYRSVSAKVRNTFLPLQKRNATMLLALYTDNPRGQPRHYAEEGDGVLTAYPAPFTAIEARVTANVEPPLLAPGQQTNRLTEKVPQIIEQAVAMHVAMFNLDGPATTLYSNQLTELLTSGSMQVSRRTRDEATERRRESRNVTGN